MPKGHRKLRLSSKKNYEKNKRPSSLIVSVPLHHISLLPISLPVSLLDSAPCSSVDTLHRRLQSRKILENHEGWKAETIGNALALYKTRSPTVTRVEVALSICVKEDLSFAISYCGVSVGLNSCEVLKTIPPVLDSVSRVSQLLDQLNDSCGCVGNSDEEFLSLPSVRRGVMKDVTGQTTVACVDSVRTGAPSLFHHQCDVIITSSRVRCVACTKHRKTLLSSVSRIKKSTVDRTDPSGRTKYLSLDTPETHERLHRQHSEIRKISKQLNRLRAQALITHGQEEVNEELDSDIRKMAEEHEASALEAYPKDSFQQIFWQEQRKASGLKDKKSMRWHPMFIRWCLYLRHVSSRAYDVLRQSGCIVLPSQRTLRDYTHYASAKIGYCDEVDRLLISSIDFSVERNRYVALIVDEVHIRDNLVYDKHEGQLIGFVDLGETNNHLVDFELSSKNDRELAKSMVVLMVRGLFTDLNFPYAQFACCTVTGELLVDPFWEAVSRLERQGIRVMALTCDGASPNRRFQKMHSKTKGLVYKVPNVFALDEPRFLYFISDPPHLLKTSRNCWWNPKRPLWREGKHIQWSHLEQLYQHDIQAENTVAGLRLVPKLKFEHIYLSSFSKMRVDLAAQALSQTVANGMKTVIGEKASETVLFVEMMDRFFDCLNVNNFSTGKQKRKPFQDPYRKKDDFRFKWLQEDFLNYLEKWERSVKARKGFTAKQKAKMMLSSETLYGIKVTIKSFVELAQFLLSVPGVSCFLSEKLCQDPLEKFFGCQRQRGRSSDNPSVSEFCTNTDILRVVNAECSDVSRGNCRGNVKKRLITEKENEPLPKRRRKH